MLENYSKLFEDSEFLDAIDTNRLCLFLGSGIALNIGMPDWQDLSKEIVKFCFKNKIITRSEKLKLFNSSFSPIKIISICTQKIEKSSIENEFNDLLKDIFYEKPRKNLTKSNIYGYLKDIYKEKKALILQTNYDVMLEKYLSYEDSINRGFYVPYSQKGNFSKDKDKVLDSIIYLHGRFSGDSGDLECSTYKSLILDKKQYNKAYVLENDIFYKNQKDFIKHILTNFYVLFLGYSLNDVEILQMIANKPETECYKGIGVIVDDCDAKNLENEFNMEYLKVASNGKIKTYIYDTECNGIKEGFSEVIQNLRNIIIDGKYKSFSTYKFRNPLEVDFE